MIWCLFVFVFIDLFHLVLFLVFDSCWCYECCVVLCVVLFLLFDFCFSYLIFGVVIWCVFVCFCFCTVFFVFVLFLFHLVLFLFFDSRLNCCFIFVLLGMVVGHSFFV